MRRSWSSISTQLLTHFLGPTGSCRIEPPDGTGFSRAAIAQVVVDNGPEYCLRGWPRDSLPEARIRGLHRLLAWIGRQGVDQVAVPVSDATGSTLVRLRGQLWQLEPWMPGNADFEQSPSDERLQAAMRCLAAWHAAAELFEPTSDEARWFACHTDAPSPAVSERLATIHRWSRWRRELVRLKLDRRADGPARTPEFEDLARQILARFERQAPHVAAQLESLQHRRYRLQPCLRDVWHDHVLFTGDEVTGLIDPSACRFENVTTDLSRLLGSLVGDDRRGWSVALDEYQRYRRLSLDELALLEALDQSSVLLSGMVWLDRLLLQDRKYESWDAVLRRMHQIVARLGERNFGV